MMKTVIALISGILFGSGMIVSQMVDPLKVLGFLNFTGNWDPSLAFVMGGALAVFIPCYHLLIKKRSHALNGETFSWTSNTKIDSRLIIGAAIFGAGWGLSGICPGPAISSLGGGSLTISAFVLSMAGGMILAKPFAHIRLTQVFSDECNKSCSVLECNNKS
jgi:uncharacterized membrane protein YedE/YeeE